MIAINLSSCTGGATIGLYYYPQALTGASEYCRCPRCGCFHSRGQWAPEPPIVIRTPPSKPRNVQLLTEEQLWELRNRAWKLSKEAIVEAHDTLKTVRETQLDRVPLQDRQRPYVRPVSKKRVCGGSSRYRVLVN